ncbi:MAG TPA: CHAT domain-containing protein [Pyrinomonadaceae bacterium]|nr:CHAT domain-containing protein [Pyrinomonadaceae bacterium]
MNERAFIKQFEAADANEMARILARPTSEQATALRLYLGDSRYERMHAAALEATASKRGLTTPSKGRVVIIHGIMGAELSNFDSPSASDSNKIWVQYWRIFRGWVERLQLNSDGQTSRYDVRATGIMQDYYGELLLHLLVKNWDAQHFWFDWRKDVNVSASELNAKINGWFGTDTAVHIVAHSMGGIVSQTFIKNHPQRWKSMWDAQSGGKKGGRLVMLGTPTYGAFIIPQVITGLEPMVRKLALVDASHDVRGILDIVNTFPGSYQMLPSPYISMNGDPDWSERMQRLYRSELYGDLRISQQHLDNALRSQKKLQYVEEPDRMIYVAGYNQTTLSNLRDPSQVRSADAYDVTKLGDGRVTHALGIPRTKDGNQIKNVFYLKAEHGEMPRDSTIIAVIDELLETGSTTNAAMKTTAPGGLRGAKMRASSATERAAFVIDQEEEVDNFRRLIEPLRWSRGSEPETTISREERKVREGLLGSSDTEIEGSQENGSRGMSGNNQTDTRTVSIEVRLVWGGIEDIGEQHNGRSTRKGALPVDAISVGHYSGVGKPLMAEQKLDESISRELMKKKYPGNKTIPDVDKLLALYSERNIVRGTLGQPFFIPDPRSRTGRLIVLAGMGEAGRFGVPELTVMARELSWSLGRLGKQHLATVLIGAGQGNLAVDQAVTAWLRGVGYALTSSQHDSDWRIQRLTFVEIDPTKIEELQDAIIAFQNASQLFAGEVELKIDYQKLDFAKLRNKFKRTRDEEIDYREEMRRKWKDEQKKQARKQRNRPAAESEDPVPVRITLSLEGKKYRFGAITEKASIPEREIALDPTLVTEANDELPQLDKIEDQLEWGRYMENLLMPDDLRPVFSTSAPVVMTLDSTTARIHWEMIAQPDIYSFSSDDGNTNAAPQSDPLDSFLGTSRGYTRQLRTTFAPTPEPPPPPRRLLRVLVVADPQEEARLPGAEQEGRDVAELFNSFNDVWQLPDNRVEVVTLFGPNEATRNAVLFHLTRRHYDILHFAGHCMFDKNDPPSSGWIFTGGQILSANELNRIDHIPKFVFSNACESGITPDRASSTSSLLAPSFAEAFFARGVANFVCTAWLVDDTAAREFALELYSHLLGLERNEHKYSKGKTESMYRAMQLARLAIAQKEYGVQTWGAYQHYGNPRLRFFDNATLARSGTAPKGGGGKAPASGKQNAAPKGRRRSATKAKAR